MIRPPLAATATARPSLPTAAPARRPTAGTIVDGLARLALYLMTATTVASVLGGLVAVVAYPPLGSGPGGGWGVPGMAYMAAAVLGVPGLFLGLADLARRRRSGARRLLASAVPFLVFAAFFFGAHLLDPCARGWLSPNSGSCQWWGGGYDVATRYHLLHHAVFAASLVAAYGLALRRLEPPAEMWGRWGQNRP